MWYWTIDKDGVWKPNEDGTTDGRALDHPEILSWLENGNEIMEWKPEETE